MLYAGLDAGGSKTKLVARCPGCEDITLVGPAANLQSVGTERCADILTDLVEQALTDRPKEKLAAVCAGLAGAGRDEDKAALIAAWRERLGSHAPDHLLVTHDGEIAIEAAFLGGSGVIVVVGTGSVAIAKGADGSLHRVGGWGYLIGDEGSGLITGLAGLRAVAHAMDGGPATVLQALLADRFGISTPGQLIHSVYQEKWRAQQFAAYVVEAAQQGDSVATEILNEQLHALALQVSWLVGA
ncbi:MAG TPA: BadF/BadG/BcrA/BcrD ATPase family protein, partial [Rhodothermales bacterium]|nr:BadF/BadG/BcrA/BcrD ATPase family protein [Rhodothermales bacterium]